MSIEAKRVGRIQGSPTVAMTAKVIEMKAAGLNVIGLGAGEPDFDTPPHIIEAAYQAMKEGKTRYVSPAGILELRQELVKKFKQDNDLDFSADQITVGTGGKQLIYNAMTATLNEGDEVIIPAPYWGSYPEIVSLFGGTPIFVTCGQENDFKMTPDQLRAAITSKTKWLMLNSPHNPTGACYSKDDLKALADVLLEKENQHVWIMNDDMYEYLVYDDFEFATIGQVEPALMDRTLTMNGLSKAYCMTGWRLGYAAGPQNLINAMNKVQSQAVTSIPTFIQYAAIAALQGPKDFIEENNQEFVKRRDMVVDRLNAIDGLTCLKPQGAFYLYPSCAGLIGKSTPDGKLIQNDEDFVTYLLDAEGIAIVHGAAFGLSPHFRISYALAYETLEDACNRIERAVNALK